MSDNRGIYNELYQKRKKIHPREVTGVFQQLRLVTIGLTVGLYFLGPWLTWQGRQAILFDLPARKFYIFGITFWPQDFILLSWLLITAAYALFFFTNLAGRLWCGYTCPQTVWTQFYFWIEWWTEGTFQKRIKLDKAPWSLEKLLRRTAKHSLWLVLALITALTFVGYFTPIKTLVAKIGHGQLSEWEFFWLGFFTIATYLNAGWMREQVCIYLCPYARFQSVMFDKDTLIISYDAKRGETRGKRKQGSDPRSLGLGDCLDCKQCVQVCPTGIDIREGLQIACIGCAACIDSCNTVMDKMGYPRGLIRYTTENNLNGVPTRLMRPRLIGYGLVFVAMLVAISYQLITRVPFNLEVIRDRQHLYRLVSDNESIENIYTLKLLNMSQQEQTYQITASGLPDLRYLGKQEVTLAPGEVLALPIRLQVKAEQMSQSAHPIYFTLRDSRQLSKTKESRFLGPGKLKQ